MRQRPVQLYCLQARRGFDARDGVVQTPSLNQRLRQHPARIPPADFGTVIAVRQVFQHDFRRRRIGDMAVQHVIPVNLNVVGQHLAVRRQIIPSHRQPAAARRQRRIHQLRHDIVQRGDFAVEFRPAVHHAVFLRIVPQRGHGKRAVRRVFLARHHAIQARLHTPLQHPNITGGGLRCGRQLQTVGGGFRHHLQRLQHTVRLDRKTAADFGFHRPV